MQAISAIAWFPTVVLICVLIFGVLTLGCACLMILKEQRPSGLSGLLAIVGTLLLIALIWQSRSNNVNQLQAKIADLEQQNQQLIKELEAASGHQQAQGDVLSDNNAQLQSSLTVLQKVSDQHEQQIKTLSDTHKHLSQSLGEVKKEIGQQAGWIQELSDQQQKVVVNIQDQLKSVSNLHATEIEQHGRVLDDVLTQIAQFKTDLTAMSANHSQQLESLEKQRRAMSEQLNRMAKQYQNDFKSLREDVEATSSRGQELNLIKASTQRELSTLRRDIDRLQENMQYLQSRRHRSQ